jgi:hypothetical protein
MRRIFQDFAFRGYIELLCLYCYAMLQATNGSGFSDRRSMLVAGIAAAVGTMIWPFEFVCKEETDIRESPLVFNPVPFAVGTGIPDEDLLALVCQRLRWRPEMSFGDFLHWLKVFGISGSREYHEELTAQTIRLLTNERSIEQHFGQAGVIVPTAHGVRYNSGRSGIDLRDDSRPTHPYQELAVFGDLGLPASMPVIAGARRFHLKDAISDCVRNLQVREAQSQEPEWATQAIAHYLPPARFWKNRWGEDISFDQWIDFLIERDMSRFSCGGTHLLHSLALLLHANSQYRILNSISVQRVRNVCLDLSREMECSQHTDGAWRADWSQSGLGATYELIDIHLTGHVLEAQLYLPQDLRISRGCAARGLYYLSNAFSTADDSVVAREYCFYSHAGYVLLCHCNQRSLA